MSTWRHSPAAWRKFQAWESPGNALRAALAQLAMAAEWGLWCVHCRQPILSTPGAAFDYRFRCACPELWLRIALLEQVARDYALAWRFA